MTRPINLDEIDYPHFTLIFIVAKSNNESNNMVIKRSVNHLSRFCTVSVQLPFISKCILVVFVFFPTLQMVSDNYLLTHRVKRDTTRVTIFNLFNPRRYESVVKV